jgi:hypothetical protein
MLEMLTEGSIKSTTPPVTGSGYKLVNTVDQLKRGGSLRLTGSDLHGCAGNANRDFSHGLELGPALDCGGTSPS